MPTVLRRLMLVLFCIFIAHAAWNNSVTWAQELYPSNPQPQPTILEATLPTGTIRGLPLASDGQRVQLLARDGRLWELQGTTLSKAKTIHESFEPMDASELQAALMDEFGEAYQVAASGQYIVVCANNNGDEWANRFEMLYHSMTHYFSTRGIALVEPTFPLVAIVFPNRDEFTRYASATGAKIHPDWLGFYSSGTNRIAMYDYARQGSSSGDWLTNGATLVHEAAHQTAYNIGVHGRWASTPRWLAEGLGTLFEAPGIYDSSNYSQFPDRINNDQLQIYRRSFGKTLKSHTLTTLLSDDRAFDRNSEKSYAMSWALMFMLAEQQPAELGQYLHVTANRQPFTLYPPEERIADFQQVFGDIPSVQSRLEDFMHELP